MRAVYQYVSLHRFHTASLSTGRLTREYPQITAPHTNTQTTRKVLQIVTSDLSARDVVDPDEDKHYECSTNAAMVLICRYRFCSLEYACERWERCVEGPARCVEWGYE
jgi:hypothetical protein